jgi:multidrug efflux pump subunit AcrB
MTLNIFSMIGIIMLMGLVTKNAILLVDFANQPGARARACSTLWSKPASSACGRSS